jgi:hypothetical protein
VRRLYVQLEVIAILVGHIIDTHVRVPYPCTVVDVVNRNGA